MRLKVLKHAIAIALLIAPFMQAYATSAFEQSKKLTAAEVRYRYHNILGTIFEQDTSITEQKSLATIVRLLGQALHGLADEGQPTKQTILRKIKEIEAITDIAFDLGFSSENVANDLDRLADHLELPIETLIDPKYHLLEWSGDQYVLPDGENYNFQHLTDQQLINFATTANEVVVETTRRNDGKFLQQSILELRQEVWRYITKAHLNNETISLNDLGTEIGKSRVTISNARKHLRNALILPCYHLGSDVDLSIILDKNRMRSGIV